MSEQMLTIGGLRLYTLDSPGAEPALVLLPGLSATAPIFTDLITDGLSPPFRAVAIDLRGRGRSDKPSAGASSAQPAGCYTMADHAADVLGVIDALELHRPILVGHSFGGMLAFYLAARHPERFARIVVLDAALALASPETKALLGPMIDRLGAVATSWPDYLAAIRGLPYLKDNWSPSIERYFQDYVEILPDGRVVQRVLPDAVLGAVEGILAEDWGAILAAVRQPVLVLNAADPYGPADAPPFLPEANARETVRALARGRYLRVSGNHLTMIFRPHSRVVARAIHEFLAEEAGTTGGGGQESNNPGRASV